MRKVGASTVCNAALLLLAAAIGCGAEPAVPVVEPAGPALTGVNDPGLAEVVDLVFEMTNEVRKESGLQPLEAHPGLMAAARRHSEEMALYNFLDHKSLDGATLLERLPTDFRVSAVAENIFGETLPPLDSLTLAKRIFATWMESEEHRLNVESNRAEYLGVAVAVAGDELRAVQVFASAPQ